MSIYDDIESGKYVNELPYHSRKDNPHAYACFMAESARLSQLFKDDLFAALGISENPKREKLYAIAYEKSHSGGFSEIHCEALAMVDLILEES